MSEVKLPRGIRNQVAAAEAIERQMAAAPQAPATVPVDQLVAPPADTTAQPPVTETPPANPPAPVQAPVDEALEQKYRTLQGKYNAEVPRLVQTTRNLEQQLQTAQAELQRLKQEPPKPQASVPDPKDVEAFGAEMIEMVRRQASSEIEAAVRAHVGSFVQRLEALEAQFKSVNQDVAVTAEQQFLTSLTQLVPNWRQVNVDQKWLEWLGQVDPVYGEARQAALDRATQSMSAERTAAIFNSFLATVAQPVVPPASELSNLVAPTRTGASQPPAPAPGPQYISVKDVEAFYRDVRMGKYNGREDVMRVMEANINRAIAENRVV